MARRKRRKKIGVVRRVKRPARYFICPVCHQPTLTIDFRKSENPGTKLAVVRCGSCGLHLELEVPEVYERVDVYGLVVDKVSSGEIEEAMHAGEGSAEEGLDFEEEGGAESVEEEGSELPEDEEGRG